MEDKRPDWACPVSLVTDRILLREFVAADFDALRVIDADPEVQRFRSPIPITPAATREFLAQAQAQAAERPRQQYALAITLRADARLVGLAGLTIANAAYDEAYLWYAIGQRDWGQGYATDAAGRLVRFGFEAAGLRRVFAECSADNPASARVLAKIGLKRELASPGSLAVTRGRLRFTLACPPDLVV